VTALDPRTPHQPEKLSNCQRTIVLYTLYFLGQQEKQISMCFEINQVQLVHRGVQRGWCSGDSSIRSQPAPDAEFREFMRFSRILRSSNIEFSL